LKKFLAVTVTLAVTVASLLLFFVVWGGSVPTPFRGPIQGAVERLVNPPEAALYIQVGELSSDGLDVKMEATVSNPNQVTVNIENLQLVVEGETGHVLIQDAITGGTIKASGNRTFLYSTTVPLTILNEKTIIATVNTRAGAAGITLPVDATATVKVPKLTSLISTPEIEVYVEPRVKPTFPLPSVEISIDVTITNTNSLGLTLGELHIDILSNGDLFKQITIQGGAIPASSSRTFSHTVTLGAEILTLIGDKVTIKASSDVGLSGVAEKIPINGSITLSLPP